MMLTILGLVLGILGLIATLVGTYLAYVSYINPMVRFRWYLKKPNEWEEFQGIESHLSIYRHRKYPMFQLVVDWDKEIVDGFQEEWVNDALYPDKTNNATFYVQLVANGMLLDKELFVSLDGHRWFVPVPKISLNADQRDFYYDSRQVQLAHIVGRYHFLDHDIYRFARVQNRPIQIAEGL